MATKMQIRNLEWYTFNNSQHKNNHTLQLSWEKCYMLWIGCLFSFSWLETKYMIARDQWHSIFMITAIWSISLLIMVLEICLKYLKRVKSYCLELTCEEVLQNLPNWEILVQMHVSNNSRTSTWSDKCACNISFKANGLPWILSSFYRKCTTSINTLPGKYELLQKSC